MFINKVIFHFTSFTCMYVTNFFGLDIDPFLTVRFHLNLADLPRIDDNTVIRKKNSLKN